MRLGVEEKSRRSESGTRDEEGYDISLIREMLRMTPDERLDWHHTLVKIIEELRHAVEN